MEKKEVLDILGLDQNLINESFRRLIDGTSALQSDDRDFIWSLFNSSEQAVKDHIAIEEEGFLTKIAREEASLMREEHKKLEEFLAEARFALSNERPVSFKALIAALKTAMTEHGKVESHIFRSLNVSDFSHDALMSLQKRISEKIV